MKVRKIKIVVLVVLMISILCTSCQLFPTQKMIDNIIPDYNKRMYTIADLIPYNYKEIKNARALYGMQLSDFFYKNIATEAELKRTTMKQKMDFYKELRFRNHNYKIMKKRYAMYLADESHSEEENTALRNKEYDEYYKIKTADSANIIKKYNDGNLSGMPLMSIRANMATATMSDVSDIYSEVMCEIYKPVVIKNSEYENLQFGDTIEIVVPATNSTMNCKETIVRNCTYVATDSLLYKNENNEDAYYFIADQDGIVPYRRILDYEGKTLEIYTETAMLQFMKSTRVAEAAEPQRLMSSVADESLLEYNFEDIVEKALCGGYLVYKYKDYVYANSITTNLKGYITSLTEYFNQRIDNEFYNTLIE